MFLELFEAFSPRDHLSPGSSALVVFVLVPGALAWLVWMMHRRAREARLALDRYETSGGGLRLVEAEVVEDDVGAPPATLHVDEEKVQRRGKNGFYTAWEERSVRPTARPFTLREAGGQTLHVEPGDAPYLHRLALKEDYAAIAGQSDRRTRALHLTAGARVFVFGRVVEGPAAPSGGDGYRSVALEAALRLPEDGPLEVHASSPVVALRDELQRARMWQFLCPAALVLIEGVVFSSFLAQFTSGRVLPATVTRFGSHTERGYVGGRYGGHSTTYSVRDVCARPDDPAEASRWGEVCSRIAGDDVGLFTEGGPARVLVVDDWTEMNEVGEHASLHWVAVILGFGAVFMFVMSAPWTPVAPWRTLRPSDAAGRRDAGAS